MQFSLRRQHQLWYLHRYEEQDHNHQFFFKEISVFQFSGKKPPAVQVWNLSTIIFSFIFPCQIHKSSSKFTKLKHEIPWQLVAYHLPAWRWERDCWSSIDFILLKLRSAKHLLHHMVLVLLLVLLPSACSTSVSFCVHPGHADVASQACDFGQHSCLVLPTRKLESTYRIWSGEMNWLLKKLRVWATQNKNEVKHLETDWITRVRAIIFEPIASKMRK